MPEPIAIVGMAALFPGAADAQAYWRNIVAGVDAITDAPAARWDPALYDPAAPSGADRFYCRRGGFVDDLATFDPGRFGVMPVAVEGAEPDQLLALSIAAAAIDDAGGEARLPDRSRIGVVLGRGGYLTAGVARLDQRVRTAHQLVATLRELVPALSEAELAGVRAAFQERLGPERPESSIGLVPNLAASRIANRLDLSGPAYTVDAACASSLIAVDAAVRELRGGRVDAMLAGGVHHCHDVTLWSVFTQLGALSRSQRIRPFDRNADGILIGEGTGAVLLKRLADARRDGDRIYAVIRGAGVASDGRASSLMAPRPDGQVRAMEHAWHDAELDPATVGLIEAHGTATAAGDATELASLARVFGGSGPEIGLGSVKSMIGHAMPAAGIAGLIKAAYAVHHGVLPPTLHCEEPHPALAGGRFAPVTAARPWEAAVRRAGVNAFGFGGINAHVVLENEPGSVALPPPGPPQAERVLLLAAPTLPELISQLDAPALLIRDDTRTPPVSGPYRLAIVAPTERRLALARRVLAQGVPWRGRNDVWFTGAPLLADGGQLAFLYPGLEQDFSPRVGDVAAHFGLAPPPIASGPLGEHGLAVVAVGRILDRALRELGLDPHVLAGHSVGEWTAMITSAMYPAEAVDAFIDRFDAASVEVPGVVFAALGCGVADAADAIAGLPDVVISHDNCPHQSIICGAEASVATALARLAARSIPGQVLPFRSGFHAPMLAPYLGPIRRNFAELPIGPGDRPVWSATTAQPYPAEPDAIRELAVRHLVEPVRFRELTLALHDAGVRAYVQVGTGSVRGFVGDTLHERPHLAIAANDPARSGLDQLRRVAAALWVEGAAPRFTALPCAAPPRTDAAPMTLALGTELVRGVHALPAPRAPLAINRTFGASVPSTDTGHSHNPESSDDNAARDPIDAELNALLRELGAAANDVRDAARAAAPTAPATAPGTATAQATATKTTLPPYATPPASPTTMPGVPPIPPTAAQPTPATHRTPTQHRTPAPTHAETREFSVRTMPYLLDHCFYRQPPGWADTTDRYPVVPMTTLLEVMRAEAERLAPGRVAVGYRNVRALRWLAAAPAAHPRIAATLDGDGNVLVDVEGFTRGTVLMADGYPTAPHAPCQRLDQERIAPFGAERLYADRWMFHGPAFQGIADLAEYGADGMRGVLVAPDTPGALLDNAGQLMGLWIMLAHQVDRLAFPGAIREITLYGPHPAAGERVGCTVYIQAVTETEVTANMELRRPDGSLWCRIVGWKDRRFGTDEVTWESFTNPETTTIAAEQPGGWFLAIERWQDSATRELIMRRYLSAAEREQYAAKNPRAQRQWLLGRIAVKDAVRSWLWARGAGPIFPAELVVTNDTAGKPAVRGAFAHLPEISLAHTNGRAVAIVSESPVGIDIEPIAGPDRSGLAETALTAPERAALGDDPADLLRVWTAKEAAAKAEGTGLGGRPTAFEVSPGNAQVTVTGPAGTHVIGTAVVDGHVISWTARTAQPVGDTHAR